jgi:cell division protein FtsW (lipid II flippase)
MMLSPWDNAAGGGEHLAQAYWSLTTGGFTGQGLGDGNTLVVPAAHTDMVMAIVGEELGLLGFLGVLLLSAVLFHRGLLVALRSGSLFGFFLGAGIVISSALQLGLIVGGMLGVVPLSGVTLLTQPRHESDCSEMRIEHLFDRTVPRRQISRGSSR